MYPEEIEIQNLKKITLEDISLLIITGLMLGLVYITWRPESSFLLKAINWVSLVFLVIMGLTLLSNPIIRIVFPRTQLILNAEAMIDLTWHENRQVPWEHIERFQLMRPRSEIESLFSHSSRRVAYILYDRHRTEAEREALAEYKEEYAVDGGCLCRSPWRTHTTKR